MHRRRAGQQPPECSHAPMLQCSGAPALQCLARANSGREALFISDSHRRRRDGRRRILGLPLHLGANDWARNAESAKSPTMPWSTLLTADSSARVYPQNWQWAPRCAVPYAACLRNSGNAEGC